MTTVFHPPKVIIGLGNPDHKFMRTRHNAGFIVLDAVAAAHGGHWQFLSDKQIATINLGGQSVLLVKPLTYMNNSGDVVPFLKKKGITPEDILVIHDELEKGPGTVSIKIGGSARGHNGLRSLIERWGTDQFARLRFGIGRPDDRTQVPHYVLEPFDNPELVAEQVHTAITLLEKLYQSN